MEPSELSYTIVGDAPLLEHQRHLVDRRHRLHGDDGLRLNVGEEGELVADVAWYSVVNAGDDDVGLDADLAQLATECCVGFVFTLPAPPTNGTSVTCT